MLTLIPNVSFFNMTGNMVKMCLFYGAPSGHARSDPILSQTCASDHVHTVRFSIFLTTIPSSTKTNIFTSCYHFPFQLLA